MKEAAERESSNSKAGRFAQRNIEVLDYNLKYKTNIHEYANINK